MDEDVLSRRRLRRLSDELYIGLDTSNVDTVATRHETFDDEMKIVAFMRHQAWMS